MSKKSQPNREPKPGKAAAERSLIADRIQNHEAEIIKLATAEYLKGASAESIAQRAGVSHVTAFEWLRRSAASKRNDTSGDES